jgi:hypothetical protein
MPSDAPLLVAEPLATRIVAMWRERAEAAERPFSTVLWLTHPGSAAAALARRRQFAPEKSLALWLAHLVEFEQATRGAARTVVTEETFLADPAAGFKRLAQATRFPPATAAAKTPPAARQPTLAPPPLGLGSGLDAALDAGYRRLSSTVSGELKRSVDALALAARPAVQSAIPPWLAQEIEADRTRMQTLADMAAGHAARAERAARDLAAAPRDARALAAQVEGLRAEQARERDALTGQIEAMRAEQAGERSALTDQIEALRAEQARERDHLTAELASARGELARITASLAEVPQAEAVLRTELGQAQRELSDERASIAKLADALEAARREADGHAHRFESARHHLERFAVEIEETRAALVAREDYCARLAAEADALHVREADHRDEVERCAAKGTRCASSATTRCVRSSARGATATSAWPSAKPPSRAPPTCAPESRNAKAASPTCRPKPTAWPTRSPTRRSARPASRSSSRSRARSSLRSRRATTSSPRGCARSRTARWSAPRYGWEAAKTPAEAVRRLDGRQAARVPWDSMA